MTTQKLPSTERLTTERLTVVQSASAYLLTNKQLVIVFALGVFFWFVFALLIRFSSGLGLLGGVVGIATFLLSIPVGWLFVLLIRALAGLTPLQLIPGISMSLAAATLCDGVAMTWTTLYGNDPRWSFLGAAYILWGVGVIIVAAYIMALRTVTR